MTLQQGIELGKLAQAKGMSVRADKGKVQLVSVTYDAKGNSSVKEESGWLTYEEAKQALAQ